MKKASELLFSFINKGNSMNSASVSFLGLCVMNRGKADSTMKTETFFKHLYFYEHVLTDNTD